MKVNIFMDYRDCNPKDATLEEVVRIIRTDASMEEIKASRKIIATQIGKE